MILEQSTHTVRMSYHLIEVGRLEFTAYTFEALEPLNGKHSYHQNTFHNKKKRTKLSQNVPP